MRTIRLTRQRCWPRATRCWPRVRPTSSPFWNRSRPKTWSSRLPPGSWSAPANARPRRPRSDGGTRVGRSRGDERFAVRLTANGQRLFAGRFGGLLWMLVLPVNVTQVGIGADALQANQVEQVQRGARIVGNRTLVHFDPDFDVQVGGELAGRAQALGGGDKILFGSNSASP